MGINHQSIANVSQKEKHRRRFQNSDNISFISYGFEIDEFYELGYCNKLRTETMQELEL